jgi:hypothetical protein
MRVEGFISSTSTSQQQAQDSRLELVVRKQENDLHADEHELKAKTSALTSLNIRLAGRTRRKAKISFIN